MKPVDPYGVLQNTDSLPVFEVYIFLIYPIGVRTVCPSPLMMTAKDPDHACVIAGRMGQDILKLPPDALGGPDALGSPCDTSVCTMIQH